MVLMKVSSNTSVGSLAGAIAGIVREDGKVEAKCVGAGALNKLVKAVILARKFVITEGIDLYMVPSFETVPHSSGEGEISVIKMLIEARTKTRLDGESNVQSV